MITFLNHVSERWFDFMVDASLQLVILFVVILLLSRLFRNRSANFHYGLWLIFLLKAIFPPFRVLPFENQINIAAQFSLPVVTNADSMTSNTETEIGLTTTIFLIWLIILLLLVAYIISKNILFHRHLRNAQPFATSRISEKLQKRLDGIPIRILNHHCSPLSFDFFRPKIYLPKSAVHWNDRQLETILLHELAHIQRKDLWANLVQTILQVVYFFHPLVWIGNRMIDNFRECACDDFVIQKTGDSIEYGKLLLAHIDTSLQYERCPAQFNYFHSRKKTLFKRFEYMIKRKEGVMYKIKTGEKYLYVGLICFAVLLSVFNCSDNKKMPAEAQKSEIVESEILMDITEFDILPHPVGGFPAISKNLRYPEIARLAGIEGMILVECLIDETGKIQETNILKDIEGNNGLKEAAIAAVTSVKWLPAKKDGKPVAARVKIPINFALKQDKASTSIELPPPSPKIETGEVPTFVPFDKPPEPIGGFAAIQHNLVYPESARRAGDEGMVMLYVLIDEQGNVAQTKILKSFDNNDCDEAAIAAIEKVQWKPALQSEKPVKVWVSVPINFRLNKGE